MADEFDMVETGAEPMDPPWVGGGSAFPDWRGHTEISTVRAHVVGSGRDHMALRVGPPTDSGACPAVEFTSAGRLEALEQVPRIPVPFEDVIGRTRSAEGLVGDGSKATQPGAARAARRLMH